MNAALSVSCGIAGSVFNTTILGVLMEMMCHMQGRVTLLIWTLTVARDTIGNLLTGPWRWEGQRGNSFRHGWIQGLNALLMRTSALSCRVFVLLAPVCTSLSDSLSAPDGKVGHTLLQPFLSDRQKLDVSFLVVPARIAGLALTGLTWVCADPLSRACGCGDGPLYPLISHA